MILASAAGVVVALMLLVAAVITSNLQLVYVAIGVSVAAALLLGIAVLGERLRARRASSATATGATATGASGQTPEAAAEPAVVGRPIRRRRAWPLRPRCAWRQHPMATLLSWSFRVGSSSIGRGAFG